MNELMRTEPTAETEQSKERLLLGDVTVLMPIGGKATRALEITHDIIPKHLIQLNNGRTVLDTICGELQAAGYRKFVFCIGHHKDRIIDHISQEEWIRDESVSYQFSEEEAPLGVDGAVINAIHTLGLKGQGLIVPGDMRLPWDGIGAMNIDHMLNGADVTLGVTSHITPRTTDVGKLIVEDQTNRLLWCYARDEDNHGPMDGIRPLTSAAATCVSMERYIELCNAFLANNPDHRDKPLSLRDDVAPWATRSGDFQIYGYDVADEILDLGTPDNINYGKQHWDV